MKLSAPIYRLKRRAREFSRAENVPLHQALDRIAREEGYESWSLLASRVSHTPGQDLFRDLQPGELVLLGARPGQGKTLLGFELLIESMKKGRSTMLFTFEYNEAEISSTFEAVGAKLSDYLELFSFDTSDDISAARVIDRLRSAPRGTVVLIDYLQLLDQKRDNPPLSEQMSELAAFARERGLVMVFISQIDRRYETTGKTIPDISDVRLPNPLNLSVFDRACFLNDGEIEVAAVA